MNKDLRAQCRFLLESWLMQLRGAPPPFFQKSAEFEATLEHVITQLAPDARADSPVDGEQDEPEFTLELIVAGGRESGRDAFTHLRKWLADATEVAICDPYILHHRPTEMFPDRASYVETIAGLFPKSVKRIDIYANGHTEGVRSPLLRLLKEGRQVRHFESSDLHDRFVIKDRVEAKAMGTSFGGFGNKFFCLLDLSTNDAAEVRSHLNNLCPFPIQRNRSA